MNEKLKPETKENNIPKRTPVPPPRRQSQLKSSSQPPRTHSLKASRATKTVEGAIEQWQKKETICENCRLIYHRNTGSLHREKKGRPPQCLYQPSRVRVKNRISNSSFEGKNESLSEDISKDVKGRQTTGIMIVMSHCRRWKEGERQ